MLQLQACSIVLKCHIAFKRELNEGTFYCAGNASRDPGGVNKECDDSNRN